MFERATFLMHLIMACMQWNCRLEMHFNRERYEMVRHKFCNKNGTSYHLWIDWSQLIIKNVCPEAKNYTISVEKLDSFIDAMKDGTRILINFPNIIGTSQMAYGFWLSTLIAVKVEMGQQVPINKRIGLDLVGPLRMKFLFFCFFIISISQLQTRRNIHSPSQCKTIAENYTSICHPNGRQFNCDNQINICLNSLPTLEWNEKLKKKKLKKPKRTKQTREQQKIEYE